jgi:hypothetical protein
MLTAENCKENVGVRFNFNTLVSDTKGSAAAKSSQHVTPKTHISSNRVRSSCFDFMTSIPDAPVLLKSNRSLRLTSLTSHLATKSRALRETLMASGSEVTGTSKMSKLNSERSQRPADVSSKLSVTYNELGRSQRHETFMNQFSAESDELGKIYPSSKSEGSQISDTSRFIECNKSQRTSRLTSQSTAGSSRYYGNVASDWRATETTDGIRFFESQKLATSAGQSKSEDCDKGTSHFTGTNRLNKRFLYSSSIPTRTLGLTSQNESESHEPDKALADNHGEMETEDSSLAVLMSAQLQNDGSCMQPQITDRPHVAVETSGTGTSALLKSRIPQRVAGRVRECMKEFKGSRSTLSPCLPTTNKQSDGMPSRVSSVTREEAFGKLDSGHCDDPVVNSGKSRLSSVEQSRAPLCFTSANSRIFTTAIDPEINNKPVKWESKEGYDISAPYSGRLTTQCLWVKTKHSPRISGCNGSIGAGTVVTRSKTKRSSEVSTVRNVCTTSDGPLEQGFEEVNRGRPDNRPESSLLHNVAASRLVEQPLNPNMHVKLTSPCTTETYKPLNIATESANDGIPPDELQYHSETKVLLIRKPPDISASKINCNNNSPTIENPSMPVLQENALSGARHQSSRMTVPSSTILNETFSVSGRGTLAVSVATQTDVIMKSDTSVQADNSVSVNSAVTKIFALFKSMQTELNALWKKQDEIQAIQKQTNAISNEISRILNDEVDTEMLREGNNHSSDAGPGDSDSKSEECQVSRRPLRRSERIAALTSVTCTGDRTFCGSKSVHATPTHHKRHDSPSAGRSTSKSANVYKELRSSFPFLKTPRSTRPVRTPKNTPTRILSQCLQNQILSLYD